MIELVAADWFETKAVTLKQPTNLNQISLTSPPRPNSQHFQIHLVKSKF